MTRDLQILRTKLMAVCIVNIMKSVKAIIPCSGYGWDWSKGDRNTTLDETKGFNERTRCFWNQSSELLTCDVKKAEQDQWYKEGYSPYLDSKKSEFWLVNIGVAVGVLLVFACCFLCAVKYLIRPRRDMQDQRVTRTPAEERGGTLLVSHTCEPSSNSNITRMR